MDSATSDRLRSQLIALAVIVSIGEGVIVRLAWGLLSVVVGLSEPDWIVSIVMALLINAMSVSIINWIVSYQIEVSDETTSN